MESWRGDFSKRSNVQPSFGSWTSHTHASTLRLPWLLNWSEVQNFIQKMICSSRTAQRLPGHTTGKSPICWETPDSQEYTNSPLPGWPEKSLGKHFRNEHWNLALHYILKLVCTGFLDTGDLLSAYKQKAELISLKQSEILKSRIFEKQRAQTLLMAKSGHSCCSPKQSSWET